MTKNFTRILGAVALAAAATLATAAPASANLTQNTSILPIASELVGVFNGNTAANNNHGNGNADNAQIGLNDASSIEIIKDIAGANGANLFF